jgi:hypothetical protein
VTDRRNSKKISEFVSQTAVPDDGFITFVYNGQNFKISQEQYLAQFGVTGTIVQSGAITGVPVLNKQATVNNIRNVEPATGIKASVSPQNGLKLETDLLKSTSGVQVLVNETTAPKIRALVAGSGIAIADTGDNIQVSVTAAPVSSKTVIVNQLSDFPPAISGVITLESDTDYLVSADISTSNRFVLQDLTSLRGADIVISNITYTGTGTMFTAVDATCKVSAIQCNFPTGTFCDIRDSSGNEGTSTFILDRVAAIGATGGTLTSLNGFQILQSTFAFTTNGFATAGINWTNLSFKGFRAFQFAGKFIDMGIVTFDRPLFNDFSMDLSAGTYGISGLPSSGNIKAGGLGIILTGRASGAGTLLENIVSTDALWTFGHNDDIADSKTDGLLSMQANATPTTITVTGTPVLVAGTWAVEGTPSRMSGTTGGRLTHEDGRTANLTITSTVTIEPVSGAAQVMAAYIAVNGSVVANSKGTASAAPGNPASITVPWAANLAPSSYVEVWVANDTGTTNVLVTSAKHRVG